MAGVLHDPNVLPEDLPVPQDDGAACHLTGMKLADIALAATDGALVNLSSLAGRTIVYVSIRAPDGRPGTAHRLGRHPGRARLHAAVLRLPRSFCRVKTAGGHRGVRAFNPGQRLSARGG